MTFSKLENPKKFLISIYLDSGCSFDEGEWEISVDKLIQGSLTSSDLEILEESAREDIDSSDVPRDAVTAFIATESGEWEGFAWHGWYDFEKIEKEIE